MRFKIKPYGFGDCFNPGFWPEQHMRQTLWDIEVGRAGERYGGAHRGTAWDWRGLLCMIHAAYEPEDEEAQAWLVEQAIMDVDAF